MNASKDLAAAICIGSLVFSSGSAHAGETHGLSYDELSQISTFGGAMALTGNFSADVIAVRALQPQSDPMSEFLRPRYFHVSVSGQLARIDDMLESRTVIVDGATGHSIYLDFAKRMYRVVDTPGFEHRSRPETAQLTNEANRAVTTTTATNVAPHRTLDGRVFAGTRTLITMAVKPDTLCPPTLQMDSSTESLVYVDPKRVEAESANSARSILQMAEFEPAFLSSPHAQPGTIPRHPEAKMDPRLEEPTRNCDHQVSGAIMMTKSSASNAFVMFSSTTTQMRSGHVTADGNMFPGLSMTTQSISERSNVHDGAISPALFTIPAGFSRAAIVPATPAPTISIPITTQ